MLFDDGFLAVTFRVEDHYVQCQYDEYQGGVCRDSCCEFFVSPSEGSDDKTPFFNFECNAGGTMLLYHCTRGDAGNVEVELGDDDIPLAASLVDTPTGFVSGGGTKILPEITEPTVWTIEYHVPWKLFERYHGISSPPASGTQWRANFYKCADQTSHPHWCDPTVTPTRPVTPQQSPPSSHLLAFRLRRGSWAPVGTPRPNFHRPSDFQKLVFA
jgi:hypothetical protein